MLAFLQAAIVCGLLAVPLLAAWASHHVGKSAVGGGLLAAAAVVAAYALFMGLEFALMYGFRRVETPTRPTPWHLLQAWWGSVRAGLRVFCWQQPFRSRCHDDFLPADSTARGVLLLHGYLCNRGFWNRWMPWLRRHGIPFIALTLEPPFAPILSHAAAIDQALHRLQRLNGRAPVVLAHSMGGLAIRAWQAAYPDAAPVHRIITLGSPHQGVALARFGLGANVRDMRPGSDLLHSLLAAETRSQGSVAYAHFICFHSECDNVVYPSCTAVLPGADNRLLPATGHVPLAEAPAVYQAVLALSTGTPEAGGSDSASA